MAMTFKKAIHHSIYKDLSTPYVSSDVICMFSVVSFVFCIT